jgi:hypothetical protein
MNPTGIIDDVSVKLPKSVSIFSFSGFCISDGHLYYIEEVYINFNVHIEEVHINNVSLKKAT